MAFLNPSPAVPLPATMWVAVRLLASQPRLSTRNELLDQMCPNSIRQAGDGSDRPSPHNSAIAALKALDELQLISEGDASMELVERPKSSTEFEQQLLTAVMSERWAESLVEAKPGPGDLLRALAWLLTLDPIDDVITWKGGAEVRQPDDKVLVNTTRWIPFVTWARSLGLAERVVLNTSGPGEFVSAAPTRAVRWVTAQEFGPDSEVPMQKYMNRILERLPVLPGGVFSQSCGHAHDQERCSPALSYALLAGEADGWLALETRSDAPESVLVRGHDHDGGWRKVTHVKMMGGSKRG